MSNDNSSGVSLPSGETGSVFFHRVLNETAARFSELASARLPKIAKQFKATYGDDLIRYEAARLGSGKRVEIARALSKATIDSLRLNGVPLMDALVSPADAPATQKKSFSGEPTLRAEVPFEGKLYSGGELLALLDKMHDRHHMTTAAHVALRWIVQKAPTIDLRDQRFALLGANAELSPVRMLLGAGATVLWVDVKPPRLDETGLAGSVEFNPAGDDLLVNPRGALATIRRFAEDGAVHLGMLAYAPGASRELRIAGSMAAIAESLEPPLLRSVSILISPTSPGEVQPEDRAAIAKRKQHLWQKALALGRVLPAPGYFGHGDAAVARAIVGLQGQAYQAAQYLTKIAWAEAFSSQNDCVVSANVAGITNTKSLEHPLFQVAFVGAVSFGIQIYTADTTRALSGLLMLHDILNPRAQSSGETRARALRSEQIHGGVYAMPWQFNAAVQTAAVIGASRKPSLLLKRKRH